jgi:hypothetical protein
MYSQCRHIMPTGRKCQSPALRDEYFCYYHIRLHNLARASTPPKDDPIKLPAPEDSTAVQLALAQVFNELGANRLDARRAGLFLYGLQIAAQIASQQARRKPALVEDEDDIVQTIFHTPEGDELGPQLNFCDDIEDCNNCPERDNCESAEGVEPRNEAVEAESQITDGAANQQAAESNNGGDSETETKSAA